MKVSPLYQLPTPPKKKTPWGIQIGPEVEKIR